MMLALGYKEAPRKVNLWGGPFNFYAAREKKAGIGERMLGLLGFDRVDRGRGGGRGGAGGGGRWVRDVRRGKARKKYA